VLLSSLEGAAVVGVKIKGVGHEFTALENVKEDILEIVLNLKQLRLKMHTEEELKLELSVSGKKTVTAGDITKNSSVEISNPDLVLAHITSSAGNLEMEIFVRPGRGYHMADSGDRAKGEIGYIEVDSIFSPIMSVSIETENVRVGKMTNWDKLIVHIKTDGTITFSEAFEEAAKILIAQYNALLAPAATLEDAPALVEETAALEEEEVAEKPAKSKKKK